MSRDQQRLADYLTHILEAIDRYTEDTSEVAFEIIGEASNNIEKHFPESVKDHPELPLVFAYQMRNAVAHGSQGGPGNRLEDDPRRSSRAARDGGRSDSTDGADAKTF